MEAARRAEAIRLLGIAQTLLQNKDFTGSRDFAILSQETDPLLDGPDQILAVADVLLAADNRVSTRNLDWYGILQVDKRSEDMELIRKQYRRLALLLHPDKNQFAWADSAFRLVAEAWGVLSNVGKKAAFDAELGFFTRVDLVPVDNQRAFGFQQFRRQEDNPPPPPPPAQSQAQHQPQRQRGRPPGSKRAEPAPPPARQPMPAPAAGSSSRGGGGGDARVANFWTTCPYCYNLYEYPKVYIECCLRCQNCDRAFHAAEIENLPPTVPGKDAYYCYWGFFPVGFSPGYVKDSVLSRNGGMANGVDDGFEAFPGEDTPTPVAKKRGRPRKTPLA